MKFKAVISNRGFTLVEILVALAISGIVMTAVYSTYYSQQKSYVTQEQVVHMQQNLRAAIFFMEREIRLAGCDPTGAGVGGVLIANSDKIQVTMDITDDAGTGDPDGDVTDTNENVTYYLKDGDLVRNSDTEIVAENIDALNFVYLTASGTTTTTPADVRAVQITLVARTGKKDQGYTNSNTYSNKQGEVIFTAPGDSYRRKRLTSEVKSRNLWF